MKKNRTMREHGNGSLGASEKRPYEKPAIAEEESYETCVVLACAVKVVGDGNCGVDLSNS